jgi:hypothetical protein
MELEDKETYVAPMTIFVAVQSEGIVCASGGPYKGFRHDGNGNEEFEW